MVSFSSEQSGKIRIDSPRLQHFQIVQVTIVLILQGCNVLRPFRSLSPHIPIFSDGEVTMVLLPFQVTMLSSHIKMAITPRLQCVQMSQVTMFFNPTSYNVLRSVI